MDSKRKLLLVGATSNLEKKILDFFSNSNEFDIIVIDRLSSNYQYEDINYYNVDIFDYKEVEKKLPEIIKNHGAFDAVVFNITHSDFRPLSLTKHDVMLKIMNENFFSFIDLLRTLQKCSGLAQGSSIVAMSSISSFRGMKAKMMFCSAKAALDAAIRSLALELSNKSIRINSIQKGFVQEDFEKENIQVVSSLKSESDTIPLGVTGGDEVAKSIYFLICSKTITGTAIVIDGGYSI